MAVAAIAFVPTAADAAITVNIVESGPGVIAIATGTLDLTGLTSQGTFSFSPFIRPSIGYVGVGIPINYVGYSGMTGPSNWGLGGITGSSQTVGAPFGINASGFGTPYVFVPVGYLSGTFIGGQASWFGQSFSSLGLTPGTYVYSSNYDTVTINVGAPVPETATWAMMIAGFCAIGIALRRRRKLGMARLRIA
jgi:hypothetical protein